MDPLKKYWPIIIIIFVICMFVKPILCALIIGGLLIYIGVNSILYLKKLRKTGVECTGTILRYNRGSKGSQTPVIEFTTTAGESISGEPFFYTSSDLDKIISYKSSINQPVVILYDAGNPKRFIIANEQGLNDIISFLVALLGFGFIVYGIATLLGYHVMGLVAKWL